ncbi:MAG TPA: STAS domain-containing protein [Jiangellaceae bacterium]|nr:STAS domain-containing protein [Jiangellaceae bacterium]
MEELPDLLTVSREIADGGRAVRLRVVGEIDMSTVATFEEALSSAVDETHDHLLVDLSEVNFMDSSGLNALVRARNALEDNGVDLVISGVSDQVRRLFEVSGLMTAFMFARS